MLRNSIPLGGVEVKSCSVKSQVQSRICSEIPIPTLVIETSGVFPLPTFIASLCVCCYCWSCSVCFILSGDGVGRAILGGSALFGVGSLCFYGLGLSGETGAIDRAGYVVLCWSHHQTFTYTSTKDLEFLWAIPASKCLAQSDCRISHYPVTLKNPSKDRWLTYTFRK